MKARSEYHNESTQLKGSAPRTSPKIFQETGKIRKVEKSASVMKYFFDKIADM